MKSLALGAVVMTSLVLPSFGADMPVKAPQQHTYTSASKSPWYAVVGGSALFTGGSADLRDRDCGNINSILPCGTPASMHGSGGGGIFGGLGYRWSPWLRTELRVGYGWSDAKGDTNIPGFPATVEGKYSSVSSLVNAYVDLASFFPLGRFEPYIGGGIGIAQNRVRSIVVNSTGGGVLTLPSGTNTSFAWTVALGTAYRLSPNFLIDVAYRYRDFGMARSDAGTGTSSLGFSFPTNGLESRALAHGIDLAIRYEF